MVHGGPTHNHAHVHAHTRALSDLPVAHVCYFLVLLFAMFFCKVVVGAGGDYPCVIFGGDFPCVLFPGEQHLCTDE